MTYDEALAHAKISPDVVGMRHPGMGKGWLVFWRVDSSDPDGGFTYHLNPVTKSEPCFIIQDDEKARTDWGIASRSKAV